MPYSLGHQHHWLMQRGKDQRRDKTGDDAVADPVDAGDVGAHAQTAAG